MLRGVGRAGTLIGVGVAVGVALVAYGSLKLAAAKPRPAAAEPARPASEIVVAAQPIPHGRRLEAGDLALVKQSGPAPLGALTKPEQAIGRVAAADIAARQPVVGSALVAEPPAGGLAALVPVGYRALSIETSDEIAVSNLVQPGDLVDVQLVLGGAVLANASGAAAADRSESTTLLQAVRVVSVGDVTAPAGRRGEGAIHSRTMTLAMTPDQVARFTLARSLGSFYLALRNPADSDPAPRTLARLSDITAAASPARPTRPAAPAKAARAQPPAGVELVVGGERQLVFPQ